MNNLYFLIMITSLFVGCQKGNNEEVNLFEKWKVEGYIANTASQSATATTSVFLTFHNNKTVDIELEINNCSASFAIEQSDFLITPGSCTEACCDSDFSEDLMELLPLIKTHYFTNGKLNLAGDDNLNIRLTKE